MDSNSYEALVQRREAATLNWRGPALMLFARSIFAIGAQGVVAAIFALRASATPWHDAEPWLPIYGTLIDAACLMLLWRFTRREGIRLFDLIGFERTHLVGTEQMTYNGYLLTRFQVLCRNTSVAVAIVAFVWSMQHAFMPLTFDAKFMLFRLLSSAPHSVFITLVYLRLRRLLPLAIAHALMDGTSVLLPLLGK